MMAVLGIVCCGIKIHLPFISALTIRVLSLLAVLMLNRYSHGTCFYSGFNNDGHKP